MDCFGKTCFCWALLIKVMCLPSPALKEVEFGCAR